jgi:hypothetical protein
LDNEDLKRLYARRKEGMSLQETVLFLREHATLEDLKTIREVFALRLRHLQSQGAQQFWLNERVLFVADGVEQPAQIVRLGRRFIVICLGNQRHVRCDVSFLKKTPATRPTVQTDQPQSTCPVQ